MVYNCPYSDTTRITITLNTDLSNSFQMIALFGTPVVTNSGLLPISVNSGTSAIIYVDVMNQASSPGTFTVAPTQCCLSGGANSTSLDCSVNSYLYFSIFKQF